jgi:hypothetical protein
LGQPHSKKSGDVLPVAARHRLFMLWDDYPPPGVRPVEACVDAVCFGRVAWSAAGDEVAWFVTPTEGVGDDVIYRVCHPTAICARFSISGEDECACAFPVGGA